MDKADDIMRLAMTVAEEALKAGDFKAAAEQTQFLLKHVPKDQDGVRVLDHDVDKKVEGEGKSSGPQVILGIKFGGILPAKNETPDLVTEGTPIDVEVVEIKDDDDPDTESGPNEA